MNNHRQADTGARVSGDGFPPLGSKASADRRYIQVRKTRVKRQPSTSGIGVQASGDGLAWRGQARLGDGLAWRGQARLGEARHGAAWRGKGAYGSKVR
jgi:hypothetical protein